MPTALASVRSYDSADETATARARLLVVDEPDTASLYDRTLSAAFDVLRAGTVRDALTVLDRNAPDVVITELSLPADQDTDCLEVCRRAKMLASPSAVLITTSSVERVPAALAAGCEAVLLKPFAPNLLFARLGRIRKESQALKTRAAMQRLMINPAPRPSMLVAGSNKLWPTTNCPRCQHEGVVSFDYASHRRMWYACLACENVWIGARQEDFKRRTSH